MLVLNAQLESFRSLKDKTLKLSFETQEVTPDQMTNIALSNQMYGFLVFSPTQISERQLEEIEKQSNDINEGQKTPSRRLRSCLFVWWQQHPNGFTKFGDFYNHHMEKIINTVKGKLD